MGLLTLPKSLSKFGTADLEAMYAALDASQAIIRFDPSGRILDANANFLAVMGYSLDEVKGQHHRMFVDRDYAASREYEAFWTSLRAGKFQQAEYKRIAKGGREVWIQATYNPILDSHGRVFKVIKFAVDVSDRKQKDAYIAGQLEAIGKAQAVIEFDLDGTIIDANDNFLATMGYSREEIVGKSHRMFVEPAFAESAEYRRFWEKLRSGTYQQAEYKRLGKGGREVWIQASYNPIMDQNGRPFRVVKYATDITAQVASRQRNERVTSTVNREMDAIGAAVDVANSQTGRVIDASEQAAGTVRAVAAGAEELSSSVQEISRSMTHSSEQVHKAIAEAEAADAKVKALTDAAGNMTGIVGLIQAIAGQINLLALNATIESARAGEAGKGFAVVATEVKALATQVATATEKITAEIDGMQSVSGAVVGALGSITSAIAAVEEGVAGVASAVEEQAAVSSDIARNMQVASTAVDQIDHSIREIGQSVDSADRAAKTVRSEIATLAT